MGRVAPRWLVSEERTDGRANMIRDLPLGRDVVIAHYRPHELDTLFALGHRIPGLTDVLSDPGLVSEIYHRMEPEDASCFAQTFFTGFVGRRTVGRAVGRRARKAIGRFMLRQVRHMRATGSWQGARYFKGLTLDLYVSATAAELSWPRGALGVRRPWGEVVRRGRSPEEDIPVAVARRRHERLMAQLSQSQPFTASDRRTDVRQPFFLHAIEACGGPLGPGLSLDTFTYAAQLKLT